MVLIPTIPMMLIPTIPGNIGNGNGNSNRDIIPTVPGNSGNGNEFLWESQIPKNPKDFLNVILTVSKPYIYKEYILFSLFLFSELGNHGTKINYVSKSNDIWSKYDRRGRGFF